jgi:hypothetical protein
MSEDIVRELTTVEARDLAEVREIAATHGVEVEEVPQSGIEPVTTTLILLVGVPLAVSAVVSILDRKKGGQIIDLRPAAPKVLYRSKDVVYGLVIVLTADGAVRVEVKQPKDMFTQVVEALAKALLSLKDATADSVAVCAAEVVGAHASVGR